MTWKDILTLILAFAAGVVVGNRSLKWRYNRIWQRYPEQFIWIAERVIERREERKRKETEAKP